MSDERKPLWPWIVAALIGLPVLYLASFGPACWLSPRGKTGGRLAPHVYWPIGWLHKRSPKSVRRAIQWHATLGDRLGFVGCHDDSEGMSLVVW